MTTCLIGGFPRAGTRQFADIFNRHPDVEIKGEVYGPSFRLAGALFERADRDHHGRWSDKAYQRRRELSALNAVAAISKGSNAPFNAGKTLRGFKCPRIERHKPALDILFRPASGKVIFFFCTRNLKANYLSAATALGVEFQFWKDQIVESLEGFFRLEADPGYALRTLDLDDFIGTGEKGGWIKAHVFDRLGFDVSVEDCGHYLSETKNSNSTLNATGRARPGDLTAEAQRMFLGSTDLRQAAARFRAATGIELWNIE